MLTLIETNEQLSIAMSKHQRAILQARKATGIGISSQPQLQPAHPGYIPPSSPPGQRDSTFASPPGPPPAAKGAVRSQDQPYQTSPPPVPARAQWPAQDTNTRTQAAAYGIPENPFTDPNAPQPNQQPKAYTLFDRSSRTTPVQSEGIRQPQPTYPPSGLAQDPSQYQPPNSQFRSSPSYTNRQDAAANNVTMHGAATETGELGWDRMARSPISPVDAEASGGGSGVNGVQRRMDDLKLANS